MTDGEIDVFLHILGAYLYGISDDFRNQHTKPRCFLLAPDFGPASVFFFAKPRDHKLQGEMTQSWWTSQATWTTQGVDSNLLKGRDILPFLRFLLLQVLQVTM